MRERDPAWQRRWSAEYSIDWKPPGPKTSGCGRPGVGAPPEFSRFYVGYLMAVNAENRKGDLASPPIRIITTAPHPGGDRGGAFIMAI